MSASFLTPAHLTLKHRAAEAFTVVDADALPHDDEALAQVVSKVRALLRGEGVSGLVGSLGY